MASTTEAGPENEDSDDQDLVGDSCCCACCHTCALLFPMLLVAAFISGLSLGAPGPTLLAIEHATRSREDQAVLLFSGRAVGAFCGALLGRFLADFVSPRTLIGCGLATAAAGNAMVPACVHIWSLMPVFAVQGFGVYLCLSAVWAAVRHRCWKQQSSSGYLSRRALLACLAAGMLLAPLVAAPFAQPGPGGLVPGNATVLDEHRPIHLMGVRVRRAINSSINATTALVESNVTMTTIAEEQSSSLLNATVSPLLSLTTQIPKPPVQRQQKLQPPLSKKPGLADGKHLDQSSSVADGSRHGRVLKLHKEQQRLGSINRVSAVSQKSIINNQLNNNTPMVTAALPTVSNNNSNNNESVATNDTLVINDHYKSNSSNNTINKLSIAAVAMTTPAATTASDLNMNATSESTTNTAKLITALSTLFTRWRRLAPIYGIYGALAFVSFIGAALAGVCALVCWRRPYDLFPSDQNSWSGEFESVEVEGGYSTEMQLDGLSDEFDESLVSALPEQARCDSACS
uniref:MFS domain-containing protein n=1 Tax=Macrostomum lignano TaxID=282301 RepID=A0A1I8I1E3_9PLAT